MLHFYFLYGEDQNMLFWCVAPSPAEQGQEQ